MLNGDKINEKSITNEAIIGNDNVLYESWLFMKFLKYSNKKTTQSTLILMFVYRNSDVALFSYDEYIMRIQWHVYIL